MHKCDLPIIIYARYIADDALTKGLMKVLPCLFVVQMSRYLSGTREFRRGRYTRCKHFVSRNFCLVCGRRYGNYLVTLYVFIKLLYLANIAVQLLALEVFLGSDYHIYGMQVGGYLRTPIRGWNAGGNFYWVHSWFILRSCRPKLSTFVLCPMIIVLLDIIES